MFKTNRRAALAGASLLFASAALPSRSYASETKLPALDVSEDLTIPRKSVKAKGSDMAYLELGEGEPVLFLHGNPTSSYLWRNVMPLVATKSRTIAVDLIGMGYSGKPDIAYSFNDHLEHVSAFVDALGLKELSLVSHDWGAGLAWAYAMNNEARVKRIAFMEGAVPPFMPIANFDVMGPDVGPMFKAFKDDAMGQKMVISENIFIDVLLPKFTNRFLGPKAMDAYRAPFLKEEDRRPLLAWPREVPIGGEPANVVKVMNDIAAFMGKTKIPALFAYADPGAFGPAKLADWYSANIANFESAYVGQGLHFIQEDQPVALGHAIAEWIRRT